MLCYLEVDGRDDGDGEGGQGEDGRAGHEVGRAQHVNIRGAMWQVGAVGCRGRGLWGTEINGHSEKEMVSRYDNCAFWRSSAMRQNEHCDSAHTSSSSKKWESGFFIIRRCWIMPPDGGYGKQATSMSYKKAYIAVLYN